MFLYVFLLDCCKPRDLRGVSATPERSHCLTVPHLTNLMSHTELFLLFKPHWNQSRAQARDRPRHQLNPAETEKNPGIRGKNTCSTKTNCQILAARLPVKNQPTFSWWSGQGLNIDWSKFPASSGNTEVTPELTTTLKEDMGQRLGALKLSHGCSLGLSGVWLWFLVSLFITGQRAAGRYQSELLIFLIPSLAEKHTGFLLRTQQVSVSR